MSSDIVKRLRDGAEYWKTIQASFEMTRAADRIEALEGEVAQLRRERHEAIEDAKASGRSYDEVLVTKEALRDELKAAEARAERLEGEVAKVKSERDKWHKAFLQTGACRACVNGWPDPHGCTDCLNTGWEQGSPPGHVPEDRLRERAEASVNGEFKAVSAPTQNPLTNLDD